MKKSLLLAGMILAIPLLLFAQSRRVTGTVSDENGNGLPGVSVVLKGSRTGATTDPNGNFAIDVSGPAPVLVISYTGMQNQELRIGNQNNFAIWQWATSQMSK